LSNRDRFIVLVRNELFERAYGVYRSLKAALKDAKAWKGIVLPLEYHAEAPRLLDPKASAAIRYTGSGNGQGLGGSDHCTNPDCEKAKMELHGRILVCPRCHSSYGDPTTSGEEPKYPDRSGHLAWDLDDLVITPAPKDKS
jgi:hypothetical protein